MGRDIAIMGAVATGAAVAVMTAGCTAAGEVPTGLANTSVSRAPAVPSSSSSSAASSRTGVDDAFRAKANAVCTPFLDYTTANPFPFADFDPEKPDPSLLPQIGDFFDRNPANHTLAQVLADLGEPGAGAVEWHTVLDNARRAQSLAQEQITVARAKDAAAFAANVKATAAHELTIKQGWERAGFAQAVDACTALE